MMTSCIGFRLRLFSLAEPSSATSARPAGSSASTPRPTTAGGDRSCAVGPRDAPAARAAAAADAQPDEPADRAAGPRLRPGPPGPRPAADQRHPGPGALGRHRRQSQRGLAGPPPPRPVAADQPAVAGRRLRRAARARAGDAARAATSRSTTRASSSASTASTSAACRARRGGSGSTPRSTSPAATSGPSSRRRRSTRAAKTSQLARRVAADLAAAGWRLERVLSDNGSEFRSGVFGDTVRELGATQTFIRAGRPATNGAVERVQRTILEECWRPSFARSLVPKLTGLTRDLAAYLRFYNEERAHTGRLTQGRTPLRGLDRRPQDEAKMTEMRRYISGAVQARRSIATERPPTESSPRAGPPGAPLRVGARRQARRLMDSPTRR